MLDLIPSFNGLGKDNCKTRRESFKFWDLVRLVSETLQYFTNTLWHHNPNLMKIYNALTWKIMIRSGHCFAHVMAAWLLWHAACANRCPDKIVQIEIKAKKILNVSIVRLSIFSWNNSISRAMDNVMTVCPISVLVLALNVIFSSQPACPHID